MDDLGTKGLSFLGVNGKLATPIAVDKPLRVLHVEDSADDADLVLLELRRGGYRVDVRRVETAAEMRAALAERAWDVVISDHSLPTFSAPEAFAVLRESGLDLPFIMVSGTVGEEIAVEAMRTGVHDYLLKGNLKRLVAAVEREIRDATVRAEQRNTRQQLLIAERMVSVGTLAAGVAHEINNPLSVVIGNLDCTVHEITHMDDASALPPELRVHLSAHLAEIAERVRAPLADAQEAADRVRLIVRDLKVFSRPDEEARGPVDVRKVLDSSIRMARNEIRHCARIIRQFENVPPVNGNEARLGQVFLNLIVNAAHAIPEGRTEQNAITLTARKQGTKVIVEVSDTGTGIAPEVLPRIFDVFYTTKPIGIGTGLGLAICHRIISGMGGEIEVESQLGAGSTFRVSLPAMRTGHTRELPAIDAVKQITRRASILIVEDEEIVARMLHRLLSSAHDTTVVNGGAAALALIDAGRSFDAILSDLMMPEMTGVELHAEVARRSTDLASRIIFITGGAFTTRAREFLDRVENPRLDKPVDVTRLKEALDRLLASVNVRHPDV